MTEVAQDAARATYILVPGSVVSKADGKRRFVSARDLANLYGVPMRHCLLASNPLRAVPVNAVYLRPRADGNYSLPK